MKIASSGIGQLRGWLIPSFFRATVIITLYG